MGEILNAGIRDLTTFVIYSGGNQISKTFRVISIYVRKEVNSIGIATLVIALDEMQSTAGHEIESDVFIPGREIRIDVGYMGDNKTIYEGIVTSHNLQITNETGAALHIECRDYVFPATMCRKNKVFEEMKDSEVITQLLEQYRLSDVRVEPTYATNESLVQYYCSDWDFLLSRAAANGLVVIPDGQSIKVIRPDVDQPSVLSLTYGANVVAFNGTLDSSAQTTSVDAVAWDAASQLIISVSGDVPTVNSQGNITPAKLAETNQQKTILQTTTANEQALKTWADAQWLKSAMGRYNGTIKFNGSNLAVPGCIIELKGLGARFDGNAYIGAVVHEIAGGNWYTTATMGIRASVAPVADDLLPGIHGLQIGKVISIDNDPTGEDRIQVQIPLINGVENRIWARLTTFWAGYNHGAFFIPDIGDEVVLGFFNDNPCHAVVLGSLYSSNKKSAYSLTDENNIRSLVSKSGIKIVFDDEKRSLTFSNSGNNIILSDAGISIESADKLILKAASGIEINAGTAVEIKGKSEITMKAVNIAAIAEATFTAKANATAELSAAGPVTVKGAMVTIN